MTMPRSRQTVRQIAPVLGSVLCACTIYHSTPAAAPRPHRLVGDSLEIVSLQRQIDSLLIQHNADSVRYETLKVQFDAIPAPAPAPVVATPDSVLKAKDAQIAALQDQLTKLTKELERIKRRMANPRP